MHFKKYCRKFIKNKDKGNNLKIYWKGKNKNTKTDTYEQMGIISNNIFQKKME